LCAFASGRVDITRQNISFGEFELNVRAGELRKGGRRIRLQEQPFQILVMLLEHPGEVVTREEICNRLWPNGTIVEFDHSIATAIKKLRQALDDDAESPRYVETMPRRGFRFIFPVADSAGAAEESPAEPSSGTRTIGAARDDAAVPLVTRRGRAGWRRIALTGCAAALVCVLGWLAWRFLVAPRLPVRDALEGSAWAQVTASSGADRDPSLSADGSLLAYSSDQSGSYEIYVKSLAPGGREVQLTSDGGQNFQPAWSPDGKLIAYYSQKRGGIWLIPALGGSARLLTDFGSRPAWSPDGIKIAFQSAESADLGQSAWPNTPLSSTLWIVAAQGGAPAQLTRPGNPIGGHGDPVWSPDGKRIVFSAESYTDSGIWSVSANGGAPQRLLPLDGSDLVYAPNGRALYFVLLKGGSWHLMRVYLTPAGNVAGAPETIVNTGNILYRHLRFSADGRFAAFSQLSSADSLQSVRISPVTGEAIGDPEPLTHDTNVRKLYPEFSPDGKKFAYSNFQYGMAATVSLADTDGKNARQLDTAPNYYFVGWFSDSRRIAHITRQDSHVILESLDIDSGIKAHLRDFDSNDSFPRLSPDGKQIAFNRWQNGVVNIWTEPVDGGPAKQLTFDKEGVGFPTWAPDGKSIIAETHPGSGSQIEWIPSDGGAPVQLTHDPGENWPRGWSPDGDKIVFAGLRDGIWNVYWVSRHTGTEKQLTHYAKPNAFVRYPAWSPRGDQIVYEYTEATGNIWLMRLK